jgi:peptide/nickel transport system substrate-binding protein
MQTIFSWSQVSRRGVMGLALGAGIVLAAP